MHGALKVKRSAISSKRRRELKAGGNPRTVIETTWVRQQTHLQDLRDGKVQSITKDDQEIVAEWRKEHPAVALDKATASAPTSPIREASARHDTRQQMLTGAAVAGEESSGAGEDQLMGMSHEPAQNSEMPASPVNEAGASHSTRHQASDGPTPSGEENSAAGDKQLMGMGNKPAETNEMQASLVSEAEATHDTRHQASGGLVLTSRARSHSSWTIFGMVDCRWRKRGSRDVKKVLVDMRKCVSNCTSSIDNPIGRDAVRSR